jgi:demethylmenaquinone methyltransferase/2-methoxy-6-polyprenyl-1,4-benzoquinol methylase
VIRADALHLPFPGRSFDVVGIAFGIRNIPDKTGAFREMKRALVPGGQVLILELTLPGSLLFHPIYRVYLCKILPWVAKLFTRNPDAYNYLADTILNYPSPEQIKRELEYAGFVRVNIYPLTLGIAHLHIGFKPLNQSPCSSM